MLLHSRFVASGWCLHARECVCMWKINRNICDFHAEFWHRDEIAVRCTITNIKLPSPTPISSFHVSHRPLSAKQSKHYTYAPSNRKIHVALLADSWNHSTAAVNHESVYILYHAELMALRYHGQITLVICRRV